MLPFLSINDNGGVAFVASLDTGGGGLFIGPDPVADEVIGLGDPLFGSTLSDILLLGESLNNTGQIAFRYRLEDGNFGIALADPKAVPEPATLALFGLALLGLGVTRSRTH